jgi:hypothetical protein
MAAKKQLGDMGGDPFGEDNAVPDAPLAKAKDDIDWDRVADALEILDRRAQKMNKAELYRLQYRLGGAVRNFQAELLKYLHRPRTSQIKKAKTAVDAFGEPLRKESEREI